MTVAGAEACGVFVFEAAPELTGSEMGVLRRGRLHPITATSVSTRKAAASAMRMCQGSFIKGGDASDLARR